MNCSTIACKTRRLLVLLTLLGAAAGAPVAAQEPPAASGYFEITTGPYGGIYHPLGAVLCRLYNRSVEGPPDRCRVASSAGSLANIEALRSGAADFAVVQRDVALAAVEGGGPFADRPPLVDLRTVLRAHTEPVTILARADSGIEAFDDLKGKRLALGVAASGQRATTDALFEAQGWSAAEFEAIVAGEPREQVDALCDGRVDAAVLVVGHPSGLVQRATGLCEARLVPVTGPAVEALVAGSGAYHSASVPGRMYATHLTDVPSFGGEALVVTLADEPEERVYRLARSAFEQIELLSRLHPALSRLTAEHLIPSTSLLPLHPGASRYLRERGLME